MLSLVKISPAVLEKMFLNLVYVFFLFHYYLPLKKVGLFIWTKLSFHHPRMNGAKFFWNWPSVLEKKYFFISSMFFRYFVIISSWKRTEPFIGININPLYPKMLCAKFGWNWRRIFFFNFVNVFMLFRNHLPFVKGWDLYLNKLESPSPKGALCQFWLR